jgi:hypothetical protein
MKYIAWCGIGLLTLLGVAAIPGQAQDQSPSAAQTSAASPSLGDYARQVRKDPGTASKPKVFDNDNLPREDKLSIVGQKPPTDTADAEPRTDNPTTPGEAKAATGDSKPEAQVKAASETAQATDDAARQAAVKQWGDKLTAQKDQIDLLARELDVLQREYQVRAAAMYADVGNRLRNSADWDKQDAQYKQQIADKQKALDDAKQKLDDMQEDARKAGVPSSVREP